MDSSYWAKIELDFWKWQWGLLILCRIDVDNVFFEHFVLCEWTELKSWHLVLFFFGKSGLFKEMEICYYWNLGEPMELETWNVGSGITGRLGWNREMILKMRTNSIRKVLSGVKFGIWGSNRYGNLRNRIRITCCAVG